MSKFIELVELYKSEFKGLGVKDIDETLLTAVAKGYGPSIYLADASRVSSSNKEEMTRFKNNFLIKKLGLTDGPELDAAIEKTIAVFGSSNRNKFRVMLSYLLVKHFKKESVYAAKK